MKRTKIKKKHLIALIENTIKEQILGTTSKPTRVTPSGVASKAKKVGQAQYSLKTAFDDYAKSIYSLGYTAARNGDNLKQAVDNLTDMMQKNQIRDVVGDDAVLDTLAAGFRKGYQDNQAGVAKNDGRKTENKPESSSSSEKEEENTSKPPAKKAPAKKTPPKKTPAAKTPPTKVPPKKTAAKKTPTKKTISLKNKDTDAGSEMDRIIDDMAIDRAIDNLKKAPMSAKTSKKRTMKVAPPKVNIEDDIDDFDDFDDFDDGHDIPSFELRDRS